MSDEHKIRRRVIIVGIVSLVTLICGGWLIYVNFFRVLDLTGTVSTTRTPDVTPPTPSPLSTPSPRPSTTQIPLASPTSADTALPPAVDPAAVVEAEFDRLATGRVLYNPPEEMTVGQRERVEVRITRSMTVTMDEELQGRGAPQVEQIPVTTFMKAHLVGDSFRVTPLSSEEQIVLGDTFTQWSWDVVPLAAGEQALSIVVTARVKIEGFPDEQRDLQVIERRVLVHVNPSYSIQAFLEKHGEWVFAILVPIAMGIGGWMWSRLARHKKEATGTGKSGGHGKGRERERSKRSKSS